MTKKHTTKDCTSFKMKFRTSDGMSMDFTMAPCPDHKSFAAFLIISGSEELKDDASPELREFHVARESYLTAAAKYHASLAVKDESGES